MDQFRAVMTAKHDEGFAFARDLIVRNGDDETASYAESLIREMSSDDPAVCLKSHLAILGLFHAWLMLLEDGE